MQFELIKYCYLFYCLLLLSISGKIDYKFLIFPELFRVPMPPGKSWKLKFKVLENPGKISLKIMH